MSSLTFQQLVNPSHLWERLLGGEGGSQGLHCHSGRFAGHLHRKDGALYEANGGHLSAWKRHLGTLNSSPVPTLSPQTTSPRGPSSMESSPLPVLYIWLERPQDLKINKNQVCTKSRSSSSGCQLNSSGHPPGPKCIIFLLRGTGGAILAAHWLSWAPGDTWLTPSFSLLP